MNLIVLLILIAACAVMFVLEIKGVPTTLDLHFKGDIKRESRWLAQYGQSVCTPVAALLVWRLDAPPQSFNRGIVIIITVTAASLACTIVKRLRRPHTTRPPRCRQIPRANLASRQLSRGIPFELVKSARWRHFRRCVAALYPQAAAVFWSLAIACAVLRYLLDAHWPSDVLGGTAVGYAMAWAALTIAHPYLYNPI